MDLSLLIFLFLFFYLANGCLTILVLAFMSKCIGATIAYVELGIGPRIGQFKILWFDCGLKVFPCNFEIHLLKKENLEDYPELKNMKTLEDLSIAKQILLNCSMLMLFFLSSYLLLGSAETIRHVLSAPSQIMLGALQPTTYAQRLLLKFDVLVESSCLTAWGVLNAKMFFLQLLPSPNFDLFRIVWTIRKRLVGEKEMGVIEAFIVIALFLPVALVFIVWFDALMDYSFDYYPGGAWDKFW